MHPPFLQNKLTVFLFHLGNGGELATVKPLLSGLWLGDAGRKGALSGLVFCAEESQAEEGEEGGPFLGRVQGLLLTSAPDATAGAPTPLTCL